MWNDDRARQRRARFAEFLRQQEQTNRRMWFAATVMVFTIAFGYVVLAPLFKGPSDQGRIAAERAGQPTGKTQPGK